MVLKSVTLLIVSWAAAMAQTPVDGDASQPPQVEKSESQPSPVPGLKSFPRTFIVDEWRIWSSPFRGSSYSSPTVKRYVIPFTLITGALIATDRKTAEVLPNTSDQTVWSGRVSQIGAAYTLAGGSGAMYLIGKLTGNKRAAETGWLGLQALGHAQVVVYGLKQISNRKRPDVSDGVGFWQGGNAFPSGHAATSFALATVVAYEYQDHIVVPITAYSLAALVSASRVSAQRHWISDVFVGSSAGFLLGRYVYKRHHTSDPQGSPVNRRGARRLIPEIGAGRHGPALIWPL